jgi:hypothetical protein
MEDIILLAQTEVGEVGESGEPGNYLGETEKIIDAVLRQAMKITQL